MTTWAIIESVYPPRNGSKHRAESRDSEGDTAKSLALQGPRHLQTLSRAPLDPLPIFPYVPVLFKPRIEGRIAIVTYAGWNAVDAEMPFDERHAPRTAKSCGPGAPTLWRQAADDACASRR